MLDLCWDNIYKQLRKTSLAKQCNEKNIKFGYKGTLLVVSRVKNVCLQCRGVGLMSEWELNPTCLRATTPEHHTPQLEKLHNAQGNSATPKKMLHAAAKTQHGQIHNQWVFLKIGWRGCHPECVFNFSAALGKLLCLSLAGFFWSSVTFSHVYNFVWLLCFLTNLTVANNSNNNNKKTLFF